MNPFVKSVFDLSFKFLVNFHLLLAIVFTIFHFVPGAYFDDEHFIESTAVQLDAPNNFYSKIKKSFVDFYTLDFGVTYQNRNLKVTEAILNKVHFSLPIVGVTAIMLFAFSILGSFLIVRYRTLNFLLRAARFINRVPQLVLIPLIIYGCCYVTSLAPLKFDPFNVRCLLLVLFTLSIKPLSQLIDLTVNKWQREKSEMYVKAAKAKGLSRSRVLLVHMFKNIASSYLGYFLTLVLQVLTGNFILESLYSIPGFGLGFMDSVSQRDLPLVVGYIFLFSSFYLVLHFLVQVGFIFLNPRLRDN